MQPVIVSVLTLSVLLLLSAFFSGSESAFFSLSPSSLSRLQSRRPPTGKVLHPLLRNPQDLLITLLLGNLLVNLLATGRATSLLLQWLGPRAGSWVAWLGMTVAILVLGEITPKLVAMRYSEPWVVGLAWVVAAAHTAITPLRVVMKWLVAPLTSTWFSDRAQLLLERVELQTAVEEAARAGSVGPFEASLVLGLLELEGIRVREVMTPRVGVRAVPHHMPARDLIRAFRRAGRTRLPVYEGSPDNVVGTVRLRDVAECGERALTAKDLARPAVFVPENLPLDRLVFRLREVGDDMAVVVDQFGSVAGIVTLHDVLEAVLGPIPDRRDPKPPVAAREGEWWVIPGDFPLEELESAVGVAVGDPLVETVAGRVLHVLGRIPAEGERIVLPEGLEVIISQADERRIAQVRVRPLSQEGRA